ncbi:MAG: DUF4288 domain-containing protein [Candidatus Riflebacteria bacterium]|nr:DUF4288 domain-containing protein [Candidatus Riflebacteria bacterium]
MVYIPENAKWYLADIIEEIKIEDEINSIVHINLVLIKAYSPEEAYKKAKIVGKMYNSKYKNTENKIVITKFRGLRDLNVIYEELEDGSEIIYSRKNNMNDQKIKKLITPKRSLGVFATIKGCSTPNFMPKSVFEDLKKWNKNE